MNIKNLFTKKQEQKNCQHNWFKTPVEVKITNYSLFSFIGGITSIYVKTTMLICKKCDKNIIVDIE